MILYWIWFEWVYRTCVCWELSVLSFVCLLVTGINNCWKRICANEKSVRYNYRQVQLILWLIIMDTKLTSEVPITFDFLHLSKEVYMYGNFTLISVILVHISTKQSIHGYSLLTFHVQMSMLRTKQPKSRNRSWHLYPLSNSFICGNLTVKVIFCINEFSTVTFIFVYNPGVYRSFGRCMGCVGETLHN